MAKPSKKDFFNMSFSTWIETASIFFEKKGQKSSNSIKVFFVKQDNFSAGSKWLARELSPQQIDYIKKSNLENFEFHGKKGPTWVIRQLGLGTSARRSHRGLIETAQATKLRDLFGQFFRCVSVHAPQKLEVIFIDALAEEIEQSLLGLELASYRFTQEYFGKAKKLPKLEVFDLKTKKNLSRASKSQQDGLKKSMVKAIATDAKAVNLARHLVNLPPNILTPLSYGEEIKATFRSMPGISLEIWEGEKLKAENMNLLLAVGQGANDGPRFVHLKYRPQKAITDSPRVRPIAFVGKGITFDSGGLDIKPSSGMRLMKKDMGGSAAVLGLCFWAAAAKYPYPLDFYLSLAENALDKKSFRPSDVIVARNGLSVEIHNTDAEGRLVLADALDVALKQSGADEPLAIINVATLTGAIKVGLGAEVAGLFCNHDILSEMLFESGREQNDLCWPMPLFQNYRNQLKSTFADMSNCSDSGFGGAISAALFLESFVGLKPWAHLDIYAWRDSVSGAFSEVGGNGQGVLMLIRFLTKFAKRGENLFA